MDKKELDEILRLHNDWVRGIEGGKRANLYGANLRGADMERADMERANLRGAKGY